MKKRIRLSAILLASALSAGLLSGCGNTSESNGSAATAAGDTVEITNVSYDPTRELYQAYNELFASHWKEETGQNVEITQSHGGSGKQHGRAARSGGLHRRAEPDKVRQRGLLTALRSGTHEEKVRPGDVGVLPAVHGFHSDGVSHLFQGALQHGHIGIAAV